MKKETKKKLTVLLGCFGLFLLLIWVVFFRLPSSYSAFPISGKVLDADTGEPIEGAIVIAIWELERGFGLEGTIASGFLNVSEVVTDLDGNYFIEGWGPLRRPGGRYLGHYAPRLVIYKDGYQHFARGNLYDSIFRDNRRDSVHRSSWDGNTIKLKKFDGGVKKFYAILSNISSNLHALLDSNFGAKRCDWLKIPKMVVAIENGNQEVISSGEIKSILIPLDVFVKRDECNINDKQAFIMEHKI